MSIERNLRGRFPQSGRVVNAMNRGSLVAGVLALLTAATVLLNPATTYAVSPHPIAASPCTVDAGTKLLWCSDFTATATGKIPTGWKGFVNGESVVEKGGDLTLSAPSEGAQFPYLYRTGNVFPKSGSFAVVERIAFPSTQEEGDGVSVVSALPPNNIPESEKDSDLTQTVWSDTTESNPFAYQPGCSTVTTSGPSTAFNTYVWQFSASGVTLSIDGTLDMTCSPLKHANIFIGNPTNIGGSGLWSSVEVKYLRVETGTIKSSS
jgi:hypothetical protein